MISDSSSNTTKEIIEALIGTASPVDVLNQLASLGVETHVTGDGVLMVKIWQVGAEGFMTPEESAQVRILAAVDAESSSLDTLGRNLQEYQRLYPNEWIAMVGDVVRAHSPTLPGLVAQVRAAGLTSPFITRITSAPVSRRTIYAAQII